MADRNVYSSDNINVLTGKSIGVFTSRDRRVGVENGISLLKSDGFDDIIPLGDIIVPVDDSEQTYTTVKLLSGDYLNALIEESTAVKVLINSSDTIDLLFLEQVVSDYPFVQGVAEAWSFTKVEDKWILNKHDTAWKSIVNKYDWLFKSEPDTWNHKPEKINWSFKTENDTWSHKEDVKVWLFKKRDDKWQK